MDDKRSRWARHFVTECFFDTVLLKRLIDTDNAVIHRRGCNNVVNELRKGSLKDSFAVALVDKDKRELNYLDECDLVREDDGFLLYKHSIKSHYIIQLFPPLEQWILEVLKETAVAIETFGFPENPVLLKKAIKFEIDSESNARLKKLIRVISKAQVARVQSLRRVLQYLEIKKYQVDIKELKNV